MKQRIEIKNLSKTFILPHEQQFAVKDRFVRLFKPMKYETFKALDDVSLALNDGEWIGIIGSNGSGKSTLLKIISGIYNHDIGKVKINGRILPFIELGVGFNPELTGRENIYLNGLILGLTKKEIDKSFNEIVEFSGLENFLDQKMKNFSSGMKLRLGFSVALHVPADIYLLDEILSVGDFAFQQKSLAALKNNLQSKSVIFVSHDLESIKKNCQRVIWLDQGKIRADGDPAEVVPMYISAQRS